MDRTIQKPAQNQSDAAKVAIRESGTVDSIEVDDKPILKHSDLTWTQVYTAAHERAEYEAEHHAATFALPGHAMDGMVCAARALQRHFGSLSYKDSFAIIVDAAGATTNIPHPATSPLDDGETFEIPGSPLRAKLIYNGFRASIKADGSQHAQEADGVHHSHHQR